MAAFAGVAGAALAAEAVGAAPVDYGWYLDFYGGALGAEGFAEALPAALRLMRQVTSGAWPGEGWDAEETSAWRRACCAAVDAFAEFGEGRVGGVAVGDFKVTSYMEKGTTGRGALLHGVLARYAPESRPRRREARPGGRVHRAHPPARHRRARVSPARRGRGEAALPGFRRRLRGAVGGDHHEPGVQQVGSVFGDDQMAAAAIDRIVHHGKLVQFRGESYRVRHALMQEG